METERSGGLLYLISLLIPLAGIIIGAILVTRNEAAEQSIGKKCLICSLLGMVVGALILMALVRYEPV